MLSRNITRLTASFIKKSPYTFDVVCAKDNFVLIKLNPKIPNNSPPTPPVPPPNNLKFVCDQDELFEIRELNPDELRDRFIYIF
jgi:hypothetical protein